MYLESLQDSDLGVRVSALRATTALLLACPDDSQRLAMKPLLPHMLAVIEVCVTSGDETNTRDVLEVFLEIVDNFGNYIITDSY